MPENLSLLLYRFFCTTLGIVAEALCFVGATSRARASLIAENLFLRKQLPSYPERGV